MQQLPNNGDGRTLFFCAFCGGKTGTRDHCPSRVFLDNPYPDNLPVVPSCINCNQGFSEDEEYLACLISCVIACSTQPDDITREKTRRILNEKPSLRSRIENARTLLNGNIIYSPEHQRVSSVITKLAQGHALYELHEPCPQIPSKIWYSPITSMDEEKLRIFENPNPISILPEVGSRASQRLIIKNDTSTFSWINVQPGRYRFHVELSYGINVRIVIDEYLACYVHWKY